MTNLTALPNIGDKLAAELQREGITSAEQLVKLGSVEVAVRITRGRAHTGYNLLYALEGAVRAVPWHALPKEDRARIRAEYDDRLASG
ncbi:MAG: TfoX/Sxy family protein [Gemmatimonadota bacterium]|nr:TfoX/Sxy family protein [Gemmatimonadota bacterium]